MILFPHSTPLGLFPWDSHRSAGTGATPSSTDSTQLWGAEGGSTTAAICWAALWPTEATLFASSVQMDGLPGAPGKAPAAARSPGVPTGYSSHGPRLPLGLLPVQQTCFAFGQPLPGEIACQWHTFLLIPIVPIASSSHARAQRKEEGSSLQLEAIWAPRSLWSLPRLHRPTGE